LYNKELEKLEVVSGLIGSALINRNGLIITSRLPRDFDERKFGALVATLFGSMEAASATINNKVLNITVEFEEFQLIVFILNEEIILATLLENNIDLGLVLIEIEEFIKTINLV
jgi:predicted regulator of Ras-like GTPase activity (Roadblock/LC7/MglB family)